MSDGNQDGWQPQTRKLCSDREVCVLIFDTKGGGESIIAIMSSSLVLAFSAYVTRPASGLVKQKTSIKYTFTTKRIDFLGQVYRRLTKDSK